MNLLSRAAGTSYPRYMIVGFIWVSILTIIAFGSSGLVPVDSRTNMPVSGIHMGFPVWGSLLEPATALSHIIEFSPDYRVGLVSISLWILFIIFLYGFFKIKARGGKSFVALMHALKATIASLLLLILYMATILISHFPDWSIQKETDAIITADLHSHCLLSHDGVVTARENLRLHKERGYDVVAFTDHVNPKGAFVAYQTVGDGISEALPGIEIPTYYGAHFYFVALGMDSDTHLPNGLAFYGGNELPLPPPELPPNIWSSVKHFLNVIHQHHGVVLTVGLHLKASDVYALAEAGVDGFEYINYGHRPLSTSVREAMLNAQRTKGIVLVASNDWHGWTGALNAWTVVSPKPSDAGRLPKNIVMDALRNHNANRIIPAVSHPVHLMNMSEIIMAPFSSILLYAQALSRWQLMSWWGWFIILAVVLSLKDLEQRHVLSYAIQTLLVSLGLTDISNGISMHSGSLQPSAFPELCMKTTCYSIVIGIILLFIALFLMHKLQIRCLLSGYKPSKWIPMHVYGNNLL